MTSKSKTVKSKVALKAKAKVPAKVVKAVAVKVAAKLTESKVATAQASVPVAVKKSVAKATKPDAKAKPAAKKPVKKIVSVITKPAAPKVSTVPVRSKLVPAGTPTLKLTAPIATNRTISMSDLAHSIGSNSSTPVPKVPVAVQKDINVKEPLLRTTKTLNISDVFKYIGQQRGF